MNILSNMFQMEVIFRFGRGPFSAMHSAKQRRREGIHIVSQQPELRRRVLHFFTQSYRIWKDGILVN
jgi:hypothetical protein